MAKTSEPAYWRCRPCRKEYTTTTIRAVMSDDGTMTCTGCGAVGDFEDGPDADEALPLGFVLVPRE